MATNNKTKAFNDDLLAQLDDLGAQAKQKGPAKSSTTRTARQGQPAQSSQSEQDLLAELDNLAQRPASRPGTPSLRPNPSTAGSRSPARTSTATPPARTSEEKSQSGQRKSNESIRSTSHQAFTPATTTTEDSPEPSESTSAPAKSGGSWWSGFTSIATAAVSQVQKAAAEIQKSEDAQKYFEQVKGNVANLRGFGGDLRALAAPTFQNIIQTIAPPISSHERLQIHITHDLTNYPTLDPLIYAVFSRVMSQVEGGDLMVVQKGQDNAPRRGSSEATRNFGSWHDGPWWRSGERRSINAVAGTTEGSKLARASAEGYSTEYFSSRGGVEEVAKKATETLSESNPSRDSEIFLAIQAISRVVEEGLFEGSSSSEKEEEGAVPEQKDEKENVEIVFAVYLHDPVHGIAFSALSQGVPAQWTEWLDAPSGGEGTLPESIEEIISSGGVDPRQWVSEWIEESLSLVVGVVAQRYVARRMGVGEAGARKGKGILRAEQGQDSVVEAGGGEAARALGGM